MVAPLTLFQAQAQAIYMGELAKIAQTETVKKGDNLSFDPQGRVLINVTPNAEQIKGIMEKIKKIVPQEGLDIDIQSLTLEEAVGKPVTPTTTVSLDIKSDPGLKNKLNTQLRFALEKIETPQNAAAIINLLNSQPKSSIIALQQEYHFHLALVSRVYEKVAPGLPKEKMAAAHQAAMIEVNKLVMDAYAKALKGAMKDGALDMAKLNKSLDKARKEILPEAHSIMMKQIVRHTGRILTKQELKGLTDGTSIKHVAEGTTATPNDVLHMDSEQGLATLIAGSENTAHDRIKGNQFAHRQLITHILKADGRVEANKNPRIQIRTPSPVLKAGLADDNAYINDVATKLAIIPNEYQLNKHLSGDKNKPKAFIYNSYTAINDTWGDINGNLQTQSADHILRGAHRYNVRQLRDNAADPVFCFVQNISVNGFGDTLGYETGNPLREESTLITEMALLHTLYATSSEGDQAKITDVFNKYKEYLSSSPRPSYFSNSPAGKEAINMIQTLKTEWKNTEEAPLGNELVDNAKAALKSLMAHNLHFDHEYSKLFQALSVFTEEASIGGCKSGNERAQAINGRVAIFDALQNQPLSREMEKISEALEQLAWGGSTVPGAAAALKTALDTEYNRVGLQSAASIVSLVDQGASAKVEAKKGLLWWFTSRNYAEEQASVMDNLHQSKAGSMQAHKSLTTMMKEAWDFGPKSWWDRLKSSPLGAVGGVLAIVILPIAVIVGLYNVVDNIERTDKENEVLAIKQEANLDADSQKHQGSNEDNSVDDKHTGGKDFAYITRKLDPDLEHSKKAAARGFSDAVKPIIASMQTTAPSENQSTGVEDEVGNNNTP